MVIMRNNLQIKSNEVNRSFQLITCPSCGYTYRLIEKKRRKTDRKCPMCGTWLFGLDFNKYRFIDKDIIFHKVR